MRYVVIDFEAFFSKEYSLKKLSIEAYIRGKEFEVHGAAIKWQADIPARWYDARQLAHVLKTEDWNDVFLIAHHMQFDGFILSHHYNVVPAMYGCTLSMARLLMGSHVGVGLDAVRSQFGLPAKRTPYELFEGKHWQDLDKPVQELIAEGACDEAESIWNIFCKLSLTFPPEEYLVVDEVIRMFVNPVLRADIKLLADLWNAEEHRKLSLVAALGLDNDAALQSSEKFKELLEAEGVEIEYKKGGVRKNGHREDIPAFGKSDDFMRSLLEHDSPRVRALAEARIGCKSSLLQTRAETLAHMHNRGALPVYLHYAGAGTLRPSGGDGANWLNFKRGSDIRKAILAPEGYLLCPVDSSQIEFRVALYLAGQMDILKNMAKGGDPYSDIATKFYKRAVYKPKKDDPDAFLLESMRGCGKQAMLMCQYGAGGLKFKATAKAGLYGPPVEMSEQEAYDFVHLYREMCHEVVKYWHQADGTLGLLATGKTHTWGPLAIRDHRIFLPNGCPLIYDTLEWHRPDKFVSAREASGYWRMKTRQGYKKMFGARLLQNICEAVSRVIVTQAMIRIKKMGIRTLNHPYDELLLLIPQNGKEEQTVEACLREMRVTPEWLPGLPLDAEAHLDVRYAK